MRPCSSSKVFTRSHPIVIMSSQAGAACSPRTSPRSYASSTSPTASPTWRMSRCAVHAMPCCCCVGRSSSAERLNGATWPRECLYALPATFSTATSQQQQVHLASLHVLVQLERPLCALFNGSPHQPLEGGDPSRFIHTTKTSKSCDGMSCSPRRPRSRPR